MTTEKTKTKLDTKFVRRRLAETKQETDKLNKDFREQPELHDPLYEVLRLGGQIKE